MVTTTLFRVSLSNKIQKNSQTPFLLYIEKQLENRISIFIQIKTLTVYFTKSKFQDESALRNHIVFWKPKYGKFPCSTCHQIDADSNLELFPRLNQYAWMIDIQSFEFSVKIAIIRLSIQFNIWPILELGWYSASDHGGLDSQTCDKWLHNVPKKLQFTTFSLRNVSN